MIIYASMDSDQITSLDLPDFSVDNLDPGNWGSSLPRKEPTSFGRRISLLGLHLPFPCIQASDGKRVCFLSFISQEASIQSLEQPPPSQKGFGQKGHNLSTWPPWPGFGQCVTGFSWFNQVASCQLESRTRVGNTSADWVSLDTAQAFWLSSELALKHFTLPAGKN